MHPLLSVLEIVDRLLGPGGCPWDQKQTLDSRRNDLLEESCEVIDAIHVKNPNQISEELGDVLFVILFYCRLLEKNMVYH